MGLVWTTALNGGLAFSAYLIARFGFRQTAGWARSLATILLAWSWLTLGMQTLGVLGHIGRGPLLGWVGLLALVGLVCWFRNGGKVEDASSESWEGTRGWTWEEVLALGFFVWGSVLIGFQSLFWPVKVMSDAPIYHLYLAARWWKSGHLDLIATPFGENAATYFPAAGDLWFTWLITGWGSDRLAKIGQFPFLVLCGITSIALSRRLGAGRSASIVAAAWFVTCTPFLIMSFEANVDTIMVAGYLLAVYFLMRYGLGDDGLASLALGSLAIGAIVATKAPGIVFAPPLVVLGGVLAFQRGIGVNGRLRGLATVLLVPLVFAGFWWGRNAVLTGNPLYPLHLTIAGRVWLPGWYGTDVMRLSRYYLPITDWRAGVDILLLVVDPRLAPVWILAVLGVWSFHPREAWTSEDRWVALCALLALLNVAIYWIAIPYRTQYRFMFHAVGLASVPLARLLDRGRFVRGLGVGLLAIHMITRAGWPFNSLAPPWDFSPVVPNSGPAPIYHLPTTLVELQALLARPSRFMGLAVAVVLGLASIVSVWMLARLIDKPSVAQTFRFLAACAAMLGIATGLFVPFGADPRVTFFENYPHFVRGWKALDQRVGPAGGRVAYAGTDLPYFLMGVGLRNDVRYVNIDAHRDWLLHDYHRAASQQESRPATWPYPRPGWDRIQPDYSAWLANLRADRMQWLVVTRVNRGEGPHNVADNQGFPIERVWADAHPETFRLAYTDDDANLWFRIYRIMSD